jgi:micrococcal nuclease
VGLPPAPASATHARVTRVVDGDTVVLAGIPVGKVDRATGGRHARLIGVDTPEVYGGVECFGRQASAFTKRELDGQDVSVDFDTQPVDRYARALVYIWRSDGTFFNGTLVAEGYAQQLTVPPNVRYAELFTSLVRQAREAERGLWSSCS